MRLCFNLSLICLLTMAHMSTAQAAVKARLGAHDTYSRLVFEWDKQTGYSVDKSNPEIVRITFKNSAPDKFNSAGLSDEIIGGVKILSENPLSIEIKIPKGAKSRDLVVGSKVILDVYGERKKKDEVKAEAKPEVKPEPKEEPKPVAEVKPAPVPVVAAPKPEVKPKQEVAAPKPEEKRPDPVKEAAKTELKPAETAKPQAEPPQPAPKAATAEPQPIGMPEKAIEPVVAVPTVVPEGKEAQPSSAALSAPAPVFLAASAAPQETKPGREKIVNSNQINVTATKGIGMALMTLNNEIWLVSDDATLLINPEVKGADAGKFQPFYQEIIEGGKLFKTSINKDANFSAQGGGLLWRLIVSPEKDKRKSVVPERRTAAPAADGTPQPRGDSIFFAIKEPTKVLDVPHPVTKKMMKIVTVQSSEQFVGKGQDFTDFTVLPTLSGLALIPKVDDLTILLSDAGVTVSRPSGLSVLSDDKVAMMTIKEIEPEPTQAVAEVANKARIFDFQSWKLGPLDAVEDNKNILLTGLASKSEQQKMEGLITIAKMYLAHGMWAEALGHLEIVQESLPGIRDNREFVALLGAAKALGWQSEDAFRDLSIDALKEYEEVNYWRAYALADLGDWQQAEAVLPADFKALSFYPSELATRLSLVLTEVALRAGDIKKAEVPLDIATRYKDSFNPSQLAYYTYLSGEVARQKGKIEDTKKLWEPLVGGKDPLYRAKGGLAMVRLKMQEKKITPNEAIDALERLRYVWRGDELETQINYWLGKTYFETGEQLKGLNILREAMNTDMTGFLAPRIKEEMSQMFVKFFSGADLEKISPLEVAAIYEQFNDLVPPGEQGNMIVERLSERLVQADLLERAAKMLQTQLNTRLQGTDLHRVGVKLAAIYLIDNKADMAQPVLDKALKAFLAAPEEYQTDERKRELALLMARAMSQRGRAGDAVAFLQGLGSHPDINRLRADIAWKAGQWGDAAAALGDVIIDQNIVTTKPITPDQANLLLQRSLAMNLAGDRAGLANMREKYNTALAATDKARAFEIVTRPRQSASLADRETLKGIVSEVDLFSEFLNSYKAPSAPVN